MREVCFCGWYGELKSREPAYSNDGRPALACPSCGRLDRLEWLSADERAEVMTEAFRRYVTHVTQAA